jgi:chromosome segregation ATPase
MKQRQQLKSEIEKLTEDLAEKDSMLERSALMFKKFTDELSEMKHSVEKITEEKSQMESEFSKIGILQDQIEQFEKDENEKLIIINNMKADIEQKEESIKMLTFEKDEAFAKLGKL